MRNLLLVKTTVLAFLCYASIVQAKTEIKVSSYKNKELVSANLLAQNSSEEKPIFDSNPQGQEQPIIKDKSESEPSTSTLPENINSSPNPLLFPTQVDEVKASNVQAITLEQAIALAKKNNKDLELASLNLDKSQQQLREVLASELPTVSATVDFTRTDSANSELSIRRAEQRRQTLLNDSSVTTSFNTGVELNYNLYTGGRRGAQIKASEQQVNFNQLEVERISEEIRLNVTNDYYDLQGADAQVKIEEAAVENAKQSLRDAELLEKAGLGTRFDVLRGQVDLANSQQSLSLAISNQKIARRQLVERIGLAQNVELMAADAIEVAPMWSLSLEETILLAYKNRAELEQFLIQKEIEQQQQKAEIAANKPQVSLFANYDVLGVANDDVGPADGFAIGARLRWNFFDGGVAKARQGQNKVDENISETRFSQQRDRIRFQVEDAYYKLQANKNNIDTATQSVVLAEESLRLARLRFQAGVGTQTDVIAAQTDLTRARGNLVRAVVTYNQQLAALQRAVSNLPDSNLFDTP